MKRAILAVLILLLPVCAAAAYKIYLKNGSSIDGVSSYQEKGKEVAIYFGTGSMTIPKDSILRIEQTESGESQFTPGGEGEVEQKQENTEKVAPPREVAPSGGPGADTFARIDELKARLNSVNTEINTTREREAELTDSINEKTGRRFHYNLIQLKQLQKELEPLRQELTDAQQKEADLIRQRDDIKAELRSLGQ